MKNSTVNIPFLLLTMAVIVGIILAYYFPVQNMELLISGLGIGVLVLGFLKIKANNAPEKGIYFGVALCPAFVLLGMLLVQLHNPLGSAQHYTKKLVDVTKPHTLVFKIQKRLKSSQYYEKYTISLQQSDSVSIKGTVLLYIQKDTLSKHLDLTGNRFVTYAVMTPLQKSLNPHQFDYANYLRNQGVYHQIRLGARELISVPQASSTTLRAHSCNLRNFLIQELEKQPFSREVLVIVKALLLGQRQDIDADTYQNYVNAGAIHILAVSGLHIGIFLWLFNFLLYPLLYLKHGKTLRMVSAIALLWGYAYLTGLSPSVLRAVTMFSFVAIGQVIRFKKGNAYNALLISGFVLLCFDPLLLFDVGFQLSYTAVFAIIWIQPLLAPYYKPRFFLDRIYWDTFTVTFAAQLGVLPLSIYYFHQFPLLFFVTNLAIVPFLGVLLGFGIGVLVLAAFGILPSLLVGGYNILIGWMNVVVAWVADKEMFLWSAISLSRSLLVISYVVLISGVLMFKKFRPQRVYRFGVTMLFFLGVLMIEKVLSYNQQRLLIFHQYKNTLIGDHTGSHLNVLTRNSISSKTAEYILEPYQIAQKIKTKTQEPLKNAYRYKRQQVVLIDSTNLYSSILQPDILLLTQSTKVHLDRVIDSLHPKKIIADGSNYPSAVQRWEATCKKHHVPFYYTGLSGAFILE